MDQDYVPYSCRHGYFDGECATCDEETEDIDKCLNCGRYVSNSRLDKYQVCIRPCKNPNEW